MSSGRVFQAPCEKERSLADSGGGKGGQGEGMRPGRHCAGAAFGGEFGNSASGKLVFALQKGFGGFVSRLQ